MATSLDTPIDSNIANVISVLASQGYTWPRLTESFDGFLARALTGISGSSSSRRKMSRVELLSALNNALGTGPVSNLTSGMPDLLTFLGGSGISFDVSLDFTTQTFSSSSLGSFSAGSIFSTSRSQNVYAPWADGHWSNFTTGNLAITDLGLFSFVAATNQLLQSSSPNTTWTKSNVTATNANQTGPDSVANSAGTIIASATNGTITQSVTASSSVQTFSVFLKRLVGTGSVALTIDGTNWVDVTAQVAAAPTSFPWARVSIKNNTLANPVCGVRIGTSGDSLAFKWAMLEALPDVTSPIDTTTATGTRNNDVIRLLDPLKSLVQAPANLSIFLEVSSSAQNHLAPNYLYLSAASTPASNNVLIKPHQDGGVWFVATNGNGHNASQHIGTLIKDEEIQRHAVSLALNSQPFVTTCSQGTGTDSYYLPQAITSTADTLPSFVGGDIVIGGTTAGGTMANRPIRKVNFKFTSSSARQMQNWATGATDPIIDNKQLYDNTILSGITSFPGFGVNLNHRTNVVTKPIPDAANLALINTLGAGWARIGWTWAETELQQASGTASLSGGQMVVTGTTGTWAIGQNIADAAGLATPGTKITGQVSGTSGKDGTYSVTGSQTVASRTLTGTAYNFTQFTSFVQSLIAAGKKIIWVLGSYHPNYGVSFGTLPTTSFGINALANFGVDLANYLAGLGIDMSKVVFEVLNETNLTPNLTGAQFAAVTNVVAPAIHAAQASALVISGGIGTGTGSNDPNTYIAAYKAAQSGFISGYADHPYNAGFNGNPEKMIADLSSFAAAAGATSAQIYATEQGTALDWVEFNETYRMVRTTRSILAAMSARVGVSCHYDAICDGPDRNIHEAGFGLADYSYNLLPSGQAFSNLMRLINGASSFDQLDTSTWLRIITLHMSAGGTHRLIWNTHFPPLDIKRTIDVVDATGLTVTDMLGNNVAYTLNGTKVTVLIREALGPIDIATTT